MTLLARSRLPLLQRRTSEVAASVMTRPLRWVCAWCLVALGGLASPSLFAVSSLKRERVTGAAATAATAGIEYVRAADFAAKFGLKPQPLPDGKKLTLKSPWTEIVLEAGSREIAHNGLRIFLGDGVRYQGGHFLISKLDAEKVFVPLLLPGYGLGSEVSGAASYGTPPNLKTIVIDPGHGGRDPGKVNAKLGVNEKTMTLDTAQRLARLLEARGYRVVLTRVGDVSLDPDKNTDLRARAHFARDSGADLFISLHYNAVGGTPETLARVRGAEVYTLTPQHQHSSGDPERQDKNGAAVALPGNAHDHWNMIIAHEVHRALVKTVGAATGVPTRAADRGLKRARFAVLREVTCPAILVEAGFLSNEEEARQIMNPEYRQQLAEAIASGIVMYDAALEAVRKRGSQ